MRVVFFGTPEFSLPTLKSIYNSKHRLISVVTSPDSLSGRGLHLTEVPVAKYAKSINIPVIKPGELTDLGFIKKLDIQRADIFVVVAYKVLPKSIFSIPEYGSMNLHASLLPKYRGSAPIEHAILNGESITGVTTFQINKSVDSGKIYLQKEVTITEQENFGTIYNKLSQIGADLTIKTLDKIENNSIKPFSQNTSPSIAPKILVNKHCRIDWTRNSRNIINKIRAFSPNRGAFTFILNKRFKIFIAEKSKVSKLKPGEISIENKKMYIGASDFAISLIEVQIEGKERMVISQFLNGNLKILEATTANDK